MQCTFQKYIIVLTLFVSSHPDVQKVVKVTCFVDPSRDVKGTGIEVTAKSALKLTPAVWDQEERGTVTKTTSQ